MSEVNPLLKYADPSFKAEPSAGNPLAKYAPGYKEEGRTVLGAVGDIGVTAAKSVVGLGSAAAGLGNLATGGLAGKGLDAVGYDPTFTQNTLSSLYSDPQKEANANVDNAKGFLGKAGAMVKNPSTIGHAILETAPLMLAGGGIGGVARAGITKLAPSLVSKFASATLGAMAGATGEGVISAGSMAEDIRQQSPNKELTPEGAGYSALAGLGTSAFGMAGGRLAQRFGFADIDTMLATGALDTAKKGGVSEIVKRIVGGGISEGAFEELPQSIQETMFQNAALGKPIMEGVPESAAQSLVVGGLMGSGANLLPSGPTQTEPADPAIRDIEQAFKPKQEVSQVAPDIKSPPTGPLPVIPQGEGATVSTGVISKALAQGVMDSQGGQNETIARGPIELAPTVGGVGIPEAGAANREVVAGEGGETDSGLVATQNSQPQAIAQPYTADEQENMAIDSMLKGAREGEVIRPANVDNSSVSYEMGKDDARQGRVSTHQDWYQAKTVAAYNKEKGDDVKLVSPANVQRVVEKERRLGHGSLSENEQGVMRYLRDKAKDQHKNDPALGMDEDLNKFEAKGYQFNGEHEVPAGNLQEGDSVVIMDNGKFDELTHKGFDKDGNAILEDGKVIHAEPWDKINVHSTIKGDPAQKNNSSRLAAGTSQPEQAPVYNEQAARSTFTGQSSPQQADTFNQKQARTDFTGQASPESAPVYSEKNARQSFAGTKYEGMTLREKLRAKREEKLSVKFSPEQAIKVAADSIDNLRPIDVYRVLSETSADNRESVKKYIIKNHSGNQRMLDEVRAAMDEISLSERGKLNNASGATEASGIPLNLSKVIPAPSTRSGNVNEMAVVGNGDKRVGDGSHNGSPKNDVVDNNIPQTQKDSQAKRIAEVQSSVDQKRAELAKALIKTKRGKAEEKNTATNRYNFLRKDLESWEGTLSDMIKAQQATKAQPTENTGADTVAPVVAKEPWMMTRAEWDKAKDDNRPNVVQSNFTKASGSQAVAQIKRLEYLLYNVGDSDKALVKALQDGSKTITEKERIELIERLDYPITHERVIKKALSEGKPVPQEVLADYPELTKTTPKLAQESEQSASKETPQESTVKAESPVKTPADVVQSEELQTFTATQLKGLRVKVDGVDKNGTPLKDVSVDAHKELSRIDDDLAIYEQLRKCMGGK